MNGEDGFFLAIDRSTWTKTWFHFMMGRIQMEYLHVLVEHFTAGDFSFC